MQCPFCQKEMGNAQNACPSCNRPHSPYVAYYLTKGWNDLKRNAQAEARNDFNEALRVTPPADQKQLQTYIAYMAQQFSTPSAVVAAAVASARPPAQPQPRVGCFSFLFRAGTVLPKPKQTRAQNRNA